MPYENLVNISLYGWFICGIAAFALLLISMVTSYWGQGGVGDTHFGLFQLCDDEGCRTYDDIDTVEGRLCIVAEVLYGVMLIVMFIYFFHLVKRSQSVTTVTRWRRMAICVGVAVIATVAAVGYFGSEMDDGGDLDAFSYGYSFYLAVLSIPAGILATVFLYLAVGQYSNPTTVLGREPVAPIAPPVATGPSAVNYGFAPTPATASQAHSNWTSYPGAAGTNQPSTGYQPAVTDKSALLNRPPQDGFQQPEQPPKYQSLH